jgi:uncharacterized NAD(P)/FAD-binding protein YdhS
VSNHMDVCVIGAGFSGVMVGAGLVRAGFGGRIALIERAERPGLGVAYNPPSERLLLNVPARNMGGWADDPVDFHKWLGSRGRVVDPGAFVSRQWYGEYLRDRLAEAQERSSGRLSVIAGEAVRAERRGNRWSVGLDDGSTLIAERLVLALGNLRPGPPPGLDASVAGPWWCPDPWTAYAHRPCRDGERVLVIGTGLTMVDVCISLTSNGARPRLTVLSRNGLLPCVHATPGLKAVVATPPAVGSTLKEILRHVRAEARRLMREGGDWRAAVDCLRPITPALWRGLSHEDRKRFVRRLRTHWDVHRHRVPAEVVARIVELQQRRSLRIVTGRVRSFTGRGESVEVEWMPRGSRAPETGVFDRVINCTGARTSVDASPLLSFMSVRGHVQSEEIGLGLLTDDEGRAIGRDGRADNTLWVLGPLRRGTLWESAAVPELRVQAADVVRHIASAVIPA